jgi:hypothetical protein
MVPRALFAEGKPAVGKKQRRDFVWLVCQNFAIQTPRRRVAYARTAPHSRTHGRASRLADDSRQIISLSTLVGLDAPMPLRARRRQLALVAEAPGGNYVLLAGQGRVEAARAAGLTTVEAIVVERLPPAFAELARRLAAGALPPAELAEVTQRLASAHGARTVADVLGLSAQHVRNLVRLRRALAPEAWAAFASEGGRASLRWWLALAALPAPDQLTRLDKRRARPRRRSNRVLEQKRRELAPNDLRARVLGWVLGVEDFPRVPGGAFERGARETLSPNRP